MPKQSPRFLPQAYARTDSSMRRSTCVFCTESTLPTLALKYIEHEIR